MKGQGTLQVFTESMQHADDWVELRQGQLPPHWHRKWHHARKHWGHQEGCMVMLRSLLAVQAVLMTGHQLVAAPVP